MEGPKINSILALEIWKNLKICYTSGEKYDKIL